MYTDEMGITAVLALALSQEQPRHYYGFVHWLYGKVEAEPSCMFGSVFQYIGKGITTVCSLAIYIW